MENNRSHKSGANSTLYNVAMKGLTLSPHMFIWTSPVFLLWKNSHLQLQCIYPFPPVILVKNPKPTVSCDKSNQSLKSNWSVASCPQNIFQEFLRWNTYVPQTRIFSVNHFVSYSCPRHYLILSICMYKFSACPCSSDISVLYLQVLNNMQSIDPPPHI